ncbi:MAG: pseudaminic acid synthase [Candidatus Omnitrophica bacterium]|nr:pseudaminic acid synthase [Candidatus Omnitrophota bacterium]
MTRIESKLTIRRVRDEDCRLLWEWVNEPAVRQSAFRSSHISWEEHLRWFRQKLSDPACLLFVLHAADGTPVSQVRFETKAEGCADVDLSVNAPWRRRGIGVLSLRLALQKVASELPKIKSFIARIKTENTASIRTFEAAGFIARNGVWVKELQAKSEDSIIQINDRRIGLGCPVYIIAEMSANHNQDMDHAIELLKEAKRAGADAVKLQTYTPDTMTLSLDQVPFKIQGTLWHGNTLHRLYQKAYLPWEWHKRLKATATELGIELFSTPFDMTAVDFLEQLEMPAYKIASFEVVDLALIERVAKTGKPILMSTGMASFREIQDAIETARNAKASELALLKCTSAYPAPMEELNLLTIPHLAETFGVPVGFSDHTEGITAPIAAVALGASIIEKHFTLTRSTPSPDAAFSLEPAEFKAMVDGIRQVEKARGRVTDEVGPEEAKSLVFRRSLFAVKNIKAGELFSKECIRSIRPGFGLHPRHLKEVLGRSASADIARGTPLTWEHVGK